jgi:hypothetical protein
MGLLIWIVHPERVTRPSDVEALFRGLDESKVGVRGWETRDAARVGRVLEAIGACESSTFSLSDGLLGPEAVDGLAALASSDAFYVDVDVAHEPADTSSRAAVTLTAARRARIRAWHDVTSLEGDVGPVQTERRDDAAETFRRWCALHATTPPARIFGHVSGVRRASAPQLLAFVKATGALVDISLDELELAEAIALARAFPDDDVRIETESAEVNLPGVRSRRRCSPRSRPRRRARGWRGSGARFGELESLRACARTRGTR